MGLYRLKLIDVPPEARAKVVDAARSCGPPLDRPTFNSLLMGTTPMPAIIATSEERGKIVALSQILGEAGASVEVQEDGAKSGAANLLAALPKSARIGAAVVGSGILVGLIGFFAIGGDEPPIERPAHVATATVATATVATATVATATVVAEVAPRPTPFIDHIATLTPDAESCEGKARDFACLLLELRKVAAALPPPRPDAGVDLDATPGDADPDAGPPPPPKVSAADYLAALEHRFVRCLADQGGAPEPGERPGLSRAIASLEEPLVYRFGAPPCTIGRREMYDCTAEVRESPCSEIYGRLMGVLIEAAHQDKVGRSAADLANALGDRLLRCASVERGAAIRPIERAYVHVRRYKLADAIQASRGTCAEADFVACAREVERMSCEALAPALASDAASFLRSATANCPSLAACR